MLVQPVKRIPHNPNMCLHNSWSLTCRAVLHCLLTGKPFVKPLIQDAILQMLIKIIMTLLFICRHMDNCVRWTTGQIPDNLIFLRGIWSPTGHLIFSHTAFATVVIYSLKNTQKKGLKPIFTEQWRHSGCLPTNKWIWIWSLTHLAKWCSCLAGRQLEPISYEHSFYHKSYFRAALSRHPLIPVLPKTSQPSPFSLKWTESIDPDNYSFHYHRVQKRAVTCKSVHLKDVCACCLVVV